MWHVSSDLTGAVCVPVGQWKDLIKKLKAKGTFTAALAICDVSGSMTWYENGK